LVIPGLYQKMLFSREMEDIKIILNLRSKNVKSEFKEILCQTSLR
jgi:hypothetical protein